MSLNLEKIFRLSANPTEAQSSWEKFNEAYKQSTGKKISINNKAPLLKIFGQSRFLSQFICKQPLVVEKYLQSPFLKKEKSLKHHQQALDKINTSEWLPSLKLYKYQELLRITLKDLNDTPQEIILRELSTLAYALLQKTDQLCWKESIEKWGEPHTNDDQLCAYHILTMGKLGGMEINYSSDIDLIAFIETEVGETTQGKALTDFFSKHLQSLSQSLEKKDAQGFLYRVDWELRPEGKSGQLVRSINSMETYYETRGVDWERQALIKANLGSGDFKLGQEFLDRMVPFIYRKNFDLESIERIQEMKIRIQNQIGRQTKDGYHVKLGQGGIREIEFFVQAHQLVYGGRNPELRSRSTLEALNQLVHHKLIESHEAQRLKTAYLFLRSFWNSNKV